MPNEPRRQSSDVLLACEETQYRASQEATPRSFNPTTGTNTMTTTTITDASATATHVGYYLKPEDGLAKDQVRVAKSLSGTVLTVDAGWTATTSVTSVRVWQPADVPVRATGAGSTTTTVSSPHASITNEPEDYWNLKGYHLLGIGGSNAGEAAQVTDFVTSTGTFTHGAFTNATGGSNQVYWLRKRLRPENGVTSSPARKSVARIIAGFGDAAPSVMTTYDGALSFDLPIRGVAAAAGSAVAAVAPVEMSDLIAAILTQDLDTGALVHATAPGTAPDLVLASGGSGFSVGGFVLASTGEVGHIRSISSNTLTLGTNHITTGNVQAGSIAYASAWYQRKATDFRTFTLDYFRGGLFRQVMHGCLPAVTIKVSREQVVTFSFAYTAGEVHEYTLSTPVAPNAAKPITIIDTSTPFDGKGARCLLNGTAVLLSDLQLDLGFRPTLRPSLSTANQADGCMMELGPVSGTFTILADEDDKASFEDVVDLMNRSGNTTVDFLYQKGAAAANTWACCMPAMQITGSPQSYADGQGVYTASFVAVKPQTVPGNTFNVALPAFSMGWL